MDRELLADFLRHRREALQPEDVGLARTARRRTSGLRREEVAMLTGMSSDYYSRLEQQRAPQPSISMLAAISRALRLSLTERDHLYRVAGHNPPREDIRSDYVSPGIRRVLDRLDTPGMVTNDLGEVLAQNQSAVALFGDEAHYEQRGSARSRFFRWFTDLTARSLHPVEEHEQYSRSYVAVLRLALGRHPDDGHVHALIEHLIEASPEFSSLWSNHDVAWRPGPAEKTFLHPEVGVMKLDCEELSAHNDSQIVLVYTAIPGTPSAEKLRLLSVIGTQVSSSTATES